MIQIPEPNETLDRDEAISRGLRWARCAVYLHCKKNGHTREQTKALAQGAAELAAGYVEIFTTSCQLMVIPQIGMVQIQAKAMHQEGREMTGNAYDDMAMLMINTISAAAIIVNDMAIPFMKLSDEVYDDAELTHEIEHGDVDWLKQGLEQFHKFAKQRAAELTGDNPDDPGGPANGDE